MGPKELTHDPKERRTSSQSTQISQSSASGQTRAKPVYVRTPKRGLSYILERHGHPSTWHTHSEPVNDGLTHVSSCQRRSVPGTELARTCTNQGVRWTVQASMHSSVDTLTSQSVHPAAILAVPSGCLSGETKESNRMTELGPVMTVWYVSTGLGELCAATNSQFLFTNCVAVTLWELLAILSHEQRFPKEFVDSDCLCLNRN